MNNRDFIAQVRARQAARDLTSDSFAPHSPGARLDISQRRVAEVCGLTVARIAALRPREWAWPHDWRELGGEVFINWASLPLLVGVLATSGEREAAAQLMRFLMPGSPTAQSDFAGAQARVSPRREKKSWLNQWEDDHENSI